MPQYRRQIIALFLSFIISQGVAQLTSELKLNVTEYTLKNGLRVLIYVDSSAPIVSTQMWYKVGSYHEPSGYTGLSHLLEHMGFKGSRKYGPGEFSRIIDENGGEDNAFTSELYTCYYENLAKDRYEIALDLESERMNNLLLDSIELVTEKQVVMEERRLRENSPTAVLWEQFYATAYLVHPYRTPVIGWMDDLERITRDDIYAHYRTYYTPQNAVLVIAGDVKPAEVIRKVERYFGRVKSRPVPRKDFYNAEPPQQGERRIKIKREVKAPTLMIGYHVCGLDDPDFFVLEMMEGILLHGRSSRWYKRLVQDLALATGVWGGNDTEKDPGLFYFYVLPKSTEFLDTIEKIIYEELENLQKVPVTQEELERVQNQVIASFIFSRDRIPSIARAIGRYTITTGSYKFLEEYPKRIAAVTKEDIMRVAKKYFFDDNRTVGILVPKEPK